MEQTRSREEHLDNEWVERMGQYTNLTRQEFYDTIYTRYKGSFQEKKTLTLEERFLLSKIKECCWGWSENPNALGMWNASRKKISYVNEFGCAIYSDEVEYADSGRTFQDWVKYRKDNKIRTFI